ncbi:Aste57867_8776 [Aphanomyces stellatus]|uniref:Aste57867_8776 protein n=1 Tax=Aphanomyces stellatus TaxID=120398 RepID=A0A485KL38_9STRA|nr:hypothetical protein As57867_008742 [Aphanomyces stellatus]VFT85662.1 Aste57867_8776 [Aphanomyces stellatus]
MPGENRYAVDVQEHEILLSSAGQQVMMEWEREYMERCVDVLAITTTCDVLEIGFGLGYSASRIQSFAPRSHTIIECDPVCLKQLEAWAADRKNVTIVAGTWQSMLASLGAFDCIFFDDYPLPQMERDESIFSISRWHEFLDATLNWHTNLGGRVTGYLARDIDLRRDGCHVTTTPLEVDVPANCNYFPYKTALVPCITLVDCVSSITTYDLAPSTESTGELKRLTTHPKLVELRRRMDLQRWHDQHRGAENQDKKDDEKVAALPRDEMIRNLKAARAKKQQAARADANMHE